MPETFVAEQEASRLTGRLDRHGPQLFLAGPCAIESRDHALRMAELISKVVEPHEDDFRWVYKSSFDKANRTAADSPRGVGLDDGLRILEEEIGRAHV